MRKAMTVLAMTAVSLAAAPFASGQDVVPGERPAASPYIDAERGLSLEDAIARALEQEPSLRADRAAVGVARAMRLQAGLLPNPAVSFERREEVGGADTQTTVMAEWPLELFRRAGRIAVAEREIEAAGHGVENRERLVAAEVRTQYGEVLAAIRDLMVTGELAQALARQRDVVRARVEEGAAPTLERDLLEVEVRRLEAERLLRAGRVEAALTELKRLLALEPGAPLAVRETLETVVLRERAARAEEDALTHRPAADARADVLEAAAMERVAEARIDRARREGRFDIGLFGGYMRMSAGFPQLGLSARGAPEPIHGVFHNIAAGAMVMVPLRNRNQGEVAAAQALKAAASARREAAALAAKAEIAAARSRDEHAGRAVAVYANDARRLARQNLEVVRQTYDLGRATVFDVVSEQRRYLETEQALTDVLREAFEARTALKRALGEVR
jgi:cobalt-zinc-cadmium efflux system outer membrane protein